MKRMLLVFTLAWIASGCMTRRIREEAALTLECPQEVVVQWNEAHQSWMAVGCGRMAICTLPEVDGADVQCGGGGAVMAARGR